MDTQIKNVGMSSMNWEYSVMTIDKRIVYKYGHLLKVLIWMVPTTMVTLQKLNNNQIGNLMSLCSVSSISLIVLV